MNKKCLAIVLIAVIALVGVAAVVLVPSALAQESKAPIVVEGSNPPGGDIDGRTETGPDDAYPIDIGPWLRAQTPKYEADLERIRAELDVPLPDRATAAYTIGDTLTWVAFDYLDPMGKNFFLDVFEANYEVKAIEEYCEVWVQTDLNYYNADGTINYLHPEAKAPLYVTDERVEYLAKQCNDIIRPTDIAFFGPYNDRDGTAGQEALVNYAYGTHLSEVDGKADRIVILVSNVRDPEFYDPINNPTFMAGFYAETLNIYGDRNFIVIDSKGWNDRVGNSGHPARAYQYESVIAHELQHLIHRDLSPGEETWVNEGMSKFAEFLTGYAATDERGWPGDWRTWPENSLTMWGDQDGDRPGARELLADYELSGAFMLYVTGRIGGVYTDTAKLTRETENGIPGFNKWLSDIAATNPNAVGLTFETLVDDFRVDMLHGGTTDDAQPGARWNAGFINAYESPLERIGGPGTAAIYLGELRDNLDREAYDWPGVPPFGTDFIEVCWSDALSAPSWEVAFAGETPAPTAWSAVAATDIYSPSAPASGNALYSGHTDLTDNFVVFGPLAVGVGDALTFDHFYNAEEGWDYGFVQVTTDTTGMSGWTSLNMSGMVPTAHPSAHPIIQANGIGFSGFSGGWLSATYDLGAGYTGEQILLAFRYSTDWEAGGQDADYPSGWAIDNVKVGSTTLTAGEVGAGRSIEEVRGAGPRFSLEFLTWTDGNGIDVNNVYTVALSAAQTATLDLAAIAASDAGFDEAGERGVLMVSSKFAACYDLIDGASKLTHYANYDLTGLPPSICMSDVELYGVGYSGKETTYAGGVVTAAVHLDNLGSSPDVTATAASVVYAGVEIPAGATYKGSTGGAAYTTDLSAVSSSFPARPGVFWIGLVSRADDFEAAFTTDAALIAGNMITATVHFANGPSPDQYFSDESWIEVVSPLALSGFQVLDPVYPHGQARSSANVLNLGDSARQVQLIADVPVGTTFVGVTGAADVVTSATQVTVTKTIAPYADAGVANISFEWQLGSLYKAGDVLTSTAKLVDLQIGDMFALDDTADVRDFPYKLYVPVVVQGD